jgi:hypothetical protein
MSEDTDPDETRRPTTGFPVRPSGASEWDLAGLASLGGAVA